MASSTVLTATRQVMRTLGLTVVFGNPGSTEQPFLKEWPSDFTYVLGLHEGSVVGMADGYARAMRQPVLVNLHTAAGVGNAMGALVTAWHNKAPLVVTAGQQTREMMLLEPLLTNVDATALVRPYVKLALETARAQDAPAALVRAHAMAVQAPTGPAFVSLPMDDWDKPAGVTPMARSIGTRLQATPEILRGLADALAGARNPALVLGAGVARGSGWEDAIAIAERLRCPVFTAPESEAASFPEDHALFQGELPPAIGPLCEKLQGYDVVAVLGAPVFRYYPYVPGNFLPAGTRLFQVTDDPSEVARAPVGDSILADPALALHVLLDMVPPSDRSSPPARPAPEAPQTTATMTADALFHSLAQDRPADAVLVQESLSSLKDLKARWPATQPDSYYTFASAGLGYGLPAAVGIALAERHSGRKRPVVAVIGDGSFQYACQALWTAAQLELPIVVVVPRNGEYGILKSFAKLEDTPGVPGLDLPGIDIALIARGYGCTAVDVSAPMSAREAFREALDRSGPTVIVAAIDPSVPDLV